MANDPYLFKDLCLTSNRGQVDGIGKGLETQGEGTFKFSIKDDGRKVHTIKIPNSLYVHDLRVCLLLPQHWAQEVGDRQTWMGNYEHNWVLHWKWGRKTVSFNATTNTPIFFTSPSSKLMKCPTLAGRLSFNSLGAGALSMSLPLYLRSLLQKKTSTIARMCQQMRESTQTTRQ